MLFPLAVQLFPIFCISLRWWVIRLRCCRSPWSSAWCSGLEESLLYLRRFGAHTKARFLVCMLVMLLKEARWVRCLIRYSNVLQWFHTKKEKCVILTVSACWDSKAQSQPSLLPQMSAMAQQSPWGIYMGWQWIPEQLGSGVAKGGALTQLSLAWWEQRWQEMSGRGNGMLPRLSS